MHVTLQVTLNLFCQVYIWWTHAIIEDYYINDKALSLGEV